MNRRHGFSLIELLTGQTRLPGWTTVFQTLLEGTRGEVLVGVEDGTEVLPEVVDSAVGVLT